MKFWNVPNSWNEINELFCTGGDTNRNLNSTFKKKHFSMFSGNLSIRHWSISENICNITKCSSIIYIKRFAVQNVFVLFTLKQTMLRRHQDDLGPLPEGWEERVHTDGRKDIIRHSFIHLFIHSFIHSFIHLFIHSFIHLFIYSFIHLFIYSFIHLFIYSFIHLFILSFIQYFFLCAHQEL